MSVETKFDRYFYLNDEKRKQKLNYLDSKYNYIFQNAIEEICGDCGLKELHKNEFSLCECWDENKDDCPCKCEIEQIELWSNELFSMIEKVAKDMKKMKPVEPMTKWDYEAYEADMRYKSERETLENFGIAQ